MSTFGGKADITQTSKTIRTGLFDFRNGRGSARDLYSLANNFAKYSACEWRDIGYGTPCGFCFILSNDAEWFASGRHRAARLLWRRNVLCLNRSIRGGANQNRVSNPSGIDLRQRQ
jgi:hypothetical protein